MIWNESWASKWIGMKAYTNKKQFNRLLICYISNLLQKMQLSQSKLSSFNLTSSNLKYWMPKVKNLSIWSLSMPSHGHSTSANSTLMNCIQLLHVIHLWLAVRRLSLAFMMHGRVRMGWNHLEKLIQSWNYPKGLECCLILEREGYLRSVIFQAQCIATDAL